MTYYLGQDFTSKNKKYFQDIKNFEKQLPEVFLLKFVVFNDFD